MQELHVGLVRRPTLRIGSTFRGLTRVASVALLAYVIFGVAQQIVTAPPALRLVLIKDIPLPTGISTANTSNSLAPGVATPFDRFDFQAYDAQNHRLFVAHTGPHPNKLTQARIPFDPAYDGHIVVFDTEQQQVIARVNIPHVTGIVIARDLHKVFAADAYDNDVYAIDESTLAATLIHLDPNESPDAISYDADDHRIFVSDPGAPADPNKTANVDRKNQNVVVIDARSDRIVAKINIGNLPKLPVENAPTVKASNVPTFGYDIGHTGYDDVQHRVFVVTQILPDADSPSTLVMPPRGTGELMAIDPVSATVVQRVVLPSTCVTPHGMALDTEQEVAHIACIEVNTAAGLVPNLVRVDLNTMQVIASDPQQMRLASVPDIVVVDHTYHVVLVGCRGGISVFDERAGAFHRLSDYHIGKNTHSIVLDEESQYLYVPIIVGGRPVLRVLRYNPTGV